MPIQDNWLAIYDLPGDIYNLINFGPNRIYIYDYQGTFVVSALLVGDTDIGGNSAWGGGFAGGVTDQGAITNALNNVMTGGSNMYNILSTFLTGGGGGVTRPQIRDPQQTAVDWKGSGEFGLNLQLLLIALTPADDVRHSIYHLLRCVYPVIDYTGSLIIPPLGYAKVPMGEIFHRKDVGVNGGLGIKIGDWFEAPPVFIMEAASFQASKEQTPSGTPLYANGSIRIKCCHQVGVTQLADWMDIGPDAYFTG